MGAVLGGFNTAMRSEGFPKGRSVIGEKLLVPLLAHLLEQLRRPLDVREEERHGPGREISAHSRDDDERRERASESNPFRFSANSTKFRTERACGCAIVRSRSLAQKKVASAPGDWHPHRPRQPAWSRGCTTPRLCTGAEVLLVASFANGEFRGSLSDLRDGCVEHDVSVAECQLSLLGERLDLVVADEQNRRDA